MSAHTETSVLPDLAGIQRCARETQSLTAEVRDQESFENFTPAIAKQWSVISGRSLENPQLARRLHRLAAALHAEFLVDVDRVPFDGAWGDVEFARDLLVAIATGQQG